MSVPESLGDFDWGEPKRESGEALDPNRIFDFMSLPPSGVVYVEPQIRIPSKEEIDDAFSRMEAREAASRSIARAAREGHHFV